MYVTRVHCHYVIQRRVLLRQRRAVISTPVQMDQRMKNLVVKQVSRPVLIVLFEDEFCLF